MNESTPQQVTFEIESTIEKGVYVNLGLITFRDTEVVIDMIFLQPQAPKAKVVSRIITSPIHAKRLLAALGDNLRKYEAAFGEIRDPNPPRFDNPPHFENPGRPS